MDCLGTSDTSGGRCSSDNVNRFSLLFHLNSSYTHSVARRWLLFIFLLW